MKRMQPGALLAVIILLPWFAAAQVPNQIQKADSLDKVALDSTRTHQTVLTDSTSHANFLADSLKLSTFPLPNIGLRLNPAATATYLFQDFTHIVSQTLPVIPLFTGESGQPRYLALGDLPARASQIIVDDVWWIPGVYGTADLTSLPDAYLQILEIGDAGIRYKQTAPAPLGIHIASDSLRYGMPFSRIDYAKGPAGADAVRVRFGRALSKRLTVYANGTFSNTDGRTLENVNGQFNEGPYDGQKVSLQFDYYVTAKWKLRYRHFNSRNEAGVAVPFFPEEWSGISQALHKETRLYHALELASAPHLSLRGFYWQVKEELNDPGNQVRHHLRDGGAEIRWAKQNAVWALQLQNRTGLESVQSTSIAEHDRLYTQLFATLGRRLTEKMWFHFDGHFTLKKDWPYSAGFAASLINQPNAALTWWLSGSVWRIPPAPGERENMLPELMANDDLQPADLQRGEIGMHWQRQRFDLHLRLNGSLWKNGFVYSPNSTMLFNNDRSQSVFAAQLHLDWEFAAHWHLAATSAQTINQLPRDFWFWHQPEGYNQVSLETIKSFFDGDLEILPRLVGRFIGKRYSPGFDTTGVKLPESALPSAPVLDVQLRLRHGDGALLFSWENVLAQKYDWRSGVPATRRFLRWGFWWNFLN